MFVPPRSFTESIIGKQATMYGTSVTGDDRALSVAVKNDLTGISYNNLGLVYNITTRKVADSIAIIPIDLNENGTIDNNENNYATLDNLLDFIDKTNNNKIPQEYVNVVFNKKKDQ
jgi:phosphate transport system substrate-binding protein